MKKAILIQEYTPAWAAEFLLLKQLYLHHLGDKLLAIEHVGSTAVPGLCAKPVIDVDLVIKDQSVLKEIIPLLETLGYIFKGEVGIPDRFVFGQTHPWVPQEGSGKLWMKHHLYVCIAGSMALRNHLSLRDALIADPTLATAYGELKKDLAQRTTDMEDYVMGKTSFIAQILAAKGMGTSELSAIAEQNKKVINPKG